MSRPTKVFTPPGLASLGSGANVKIAVDLGDDWKLYGPLLIVITGTAALASIAESASDNGTVATMPLPGSAADGSLAMSLTGAGTVQGETLVCGQWVILDITNGASAQGATANVRLLAFPNGT